MKAVKVVLILLCISMLILWVRGGESFDIRKTLPLVNEKPQLYQFGSVAMIGLLLWGLMRLRRQDRSRDEHFRDDDFDSTL